MDTPSAKLLKITQELISHDPSFSPQKLRVFLFIAENEGCSKKELIEYTHQPQASIQRLIDSLSNKQRQDKSKHTLLNWIEQRPIKAKGAPKAYFLTDEGRQIIYNIESTINLGEGYENH